MESAFPSRINISSNASPTPPTHASPHVKPVAADGSARGTPARIPSPGATERRLKLIIDSVPFGLTVVEASGNILAANHAFLSLWGLETAAPVVGKHFGTLAVIEHRERIAAFVDEVSSGTTTSVEYTVVRSDGASRSLETKGVPLPRMDGGTVVLSATWDVTDQKRVLSAYEELRTRHAALESQRDALSEALQAATQAHHADLATQRDKIDDVVRSVQHEMQAALAEVEQRHAQASREWAVERETLAAKLGEADVRTAALSSELIAERAARQAALDNAENQRHQADAMAARGTQIEQELRASLEARDAALAALRTEHEQLAQTLQDLNRSYAVLASERAEERSTFTDALRNERSRSAELIMEREAWRASLMEVVQTAKQTGDQAQDLLDKCKNLRLVVPAVHQQATQEQPEGTSSADSIGASPEDDSWRF